MAECPIGSRFNGSSYAIEVTSNRAEVAVLMTMRTRPLPFANFPDLTHCIIVKPKSVRLFIKPYCGWCDKAMRWLDQHGVDYETINVMDDEAAYDEMIRLSGQDLAPVIDVDGDILADFGPEQLPDFFKKRGNARVQLH